MSQKLKLTSLVSSITLLALGGMVAVACGDKKPGEASCGEIGARVSALSESAAALEDVAGSIKVEVIGACARIAGMAAPTGDPTDQQVTDTCNLATTRINGAITGSVSVTVVPPTCTVDAAAQFDCEADCYAEAEVTCTPGELEARCEPGELSVQCSGKCEVGATCSGTAPTIAVACEGKCEGTCTGTCAGTCDGECSVALDSAGKCAGECTGSCSTTCEGTCKGSCEITAEGGVTCSGEARCKGGCDGTATAPKCEANLKPPACEGSANVDCSADCEGSASLNATCTPAAIDVVGTVDATFEADLKAGLPILLGVTARAELAGDAVADIGGNMADVAGSIGSCALELGSVAAQFTAAATASVKAAASVSVSFKASASVSGSATAG
jgi:hypothetical protein